MNTPTSGNPSPERIRAAKPCCTGGRGWAPAHPPKTTEPEKRRAPQKDRGKGSLRTSSAQPLQNHKNTGPRRSARITGQRSSPEERPSESPRHRPGSQASATPSGRAEKGCPRPKGRVSEPGSAGKGSSGGEGGENSGTVVVAVSPRHLLDEWATGTPAQINYPIGDLYKTNVYELSKYLNIPQEIRTP